MNNEPIELLRIYGNDKIVDSYVELIALLNDLYKYIEPELHTGNIYIFKILDTDNSPVLNDSSPLLTFSDLLVPEISSDLAIQINTDNSMHYWHPVIIDDILLLSDNKLIYEYSNEEERFILNSHFVNINKDSISQGSKYATTFEDCRVSLNIYKNTHARKSSCPILNSIWFDADRIFLNQKPEDKMQESLKLFLYSFNSSLIVKGEVEVIREHPTDVTEPVDIRLLWKHRNRAVIIEIKWLGYSVDQNGKKTTDFSNSRAVDGLKQLVDQYIENYKRDNPMDMVKGILVTFDARRAYLKEGQVTISRDDGFKYEYKEINIPDDKKYYLDRIDVDDPIRMFMEPVCR